MVMRCHPSSEHNFLIESIKALHVYGWIMIVVNKLMHPSRSHGMNVNSMCVCGGGGGPAMAAKAGRR